MVQSVQRACRLLQILEPAGTALRLAEIARRSGLHKATALRLLQTLEQEGFVARSGQEGYRSLVKAAGRRRYRLGFSSRGVDTPFSRSVTEGVERAAAEAGMDLVTVVTHRSPRTTLRKAEELVRERVDLVIEFQTHERIAAAIASRFLTAGIPVIAIEIPHPGAVFFGADNYRAGLIGGRALAQWIRKHWRGQVEALLTLEEGIAGALPRLRVTGMLEALRMLLPGVERLPATQLDGRGAFDRSLELVRRYLRRTPEQRTAVLASNDPMALGAVRAFEESGRARSCTVMGQNATLDVRVELRRKGSALAGSVAYFPERYGEQVLRLAAEMLAGRTIPPAVFTHHELVTAGNVDRLYPLDPVASLT